MQPQDYSKLLSDTHQTQWSNPAFSNQFGGNVLQGAKFMGWLGDNPDLMNAYQNNQSGSNPMPQVGLGISGSAGNNLPAQNSALQNSMSNSQNTPSLGSQSISGQNGYTNNSLYPNNTSTPSTFSGQPTNSQNVNNPNSSSLTFLGGNLTPGMSGDQVKGLQNYLISQGYKIPAGATGYYGDQTKNAVQQWQQKSGIQPNVPSDYGYFGPKSIAFLKGQMGQASPNTQTSNVPTPTGGQNVPPSTSNTSTSNYGTSLGMNAPMGTTAPTNGVSQETSSTTETSTGNTQFNPQTDNSSNSYLQDYLKTLALSPQELEAQQKIQELEAKQGNISAGNRLGQVDVAGQPIATSFITGQQSAIENRGNAQIEALKAQETPYQQQLALAQSRRSAASDVLKAGLDYSKWQQEQSKPVFGGYGTQGYQLNPATGKYESIGSTGINTNEQNLITQAIADNRLDPSQLNKLGLKAIADTLALEPNHNFVTGKQALTNSTSYMMDAFGNIVANKKYPGASGATTGNTNNSSLSTGNKYIQPNTHTVKSGDIFHQIALNNGMTNEQLKALNPQIADISKITPGQKINLSGGQTQNTSNTMKFPKADEASLTEQTKYADTTQRAFNTANQNLNSLVGFMNSAKVNNASTIPLINSIQNAVKGGLLDAGTIAGYQAALSGLRAEYAQVLSRGGEVTEGSRAQAKSLIPDNLTPSQLKQVADRLNIEGSNAIKEAQQQIQTIKNRATGKTTSQSTGGGYSDYLKAIGL